mmetsp:Transcript_4568/g.6866  ORF Transcript_4568/g.6866 Transcript_4568/m.6866 type:complete len:185 (-) Transcript_4568:350-904(-)
MDREGRNVISPQDLLSSYDAARHPDVQMGLKSESVVLQEFLDTFDVGSSIDGKITRDEFVEYYMNIAAAVSDDDYMEMIIRRTWHLGDAVSNSSRFAAKEGGLVSRTREALQNSNNKNDSQHDVVSRPLTASGAHSLLSLPTILLPRPSPFQSLHIFGRFRYFFYWSSSESVPCKWCEKRTGIN